MKINIIAFLVLFSIAGIGLAQSTQTGSSMTGQPQSGASAQSGSAPVGDNTVSAGNGTTEMNGANEENSDEPNTEINSDNSAL